MNVFDVPVATFLAEIEGLSQQAFESSSCAPFLIVRARQTTSDQQFVTATVDDWAAGEGAELAADDRVFALAKSDRNTFSGMITVGRVSNNDIIIDDPSVSKIHAVFKAVATDYTLTDFGSKNGTFLDGTKLEPKVAVPITNGQAIRFGTIVEARFFSPAGLFEYLRQG